MSEKDKKEFNAAKSILLQNKYELLNNINDKLVDYIYFEDKNLDKENEQLLREAASNIEKVLESIQLSAASQINKCFKN